MQCVDVGHAAGVRIHRDRAYSRACPASHAMASLTWAVDSLDEIGGHACQVFGSPKVIDTDDGGHVSDESGAPCASPPPWPGQ